MERDFDKREDDLVDLGSVTAETKGNKGNFNDLPGERATPGLLAG